MNIAPLSSSKAGNAGGINGVNDIKAKNSDDSFEKRLQSAFDQQDEKALKKVCKDFESIMLNMMYRQMKASIQQSNLVDAHPGREIFQSMLDEKLMDEASRSGGIGLGDTLYKQLSRRLKSAYKLED